MHLKVHHELENRGFIEAHGEHSLIETERLENRKPQVKGHEEGIKERPFGRHSKHNLEVDHLNPGGEISGEALHLKVKQGRNQGGIIKAQNIHVSGGEWSNRPLPVRQLVHLKSGTPLPWKKKQAWSTRTDFTGALMSAGEHLSLHLQGRFLNEASDVVSWGSLSIQAGHIVQKTAFHSYLSQSKEDLAVKKDKHAVIMREGTIQSIEGNVSLTSTSGNIELEGKVGSYLGDVNIQSAQDLLFSATSQSVEDKTSRRRWSPTAVSQQITKVNSTQTRLPTLFSGGSTTLKAKGRVILEELQATIKEDLHIRAQEVQTIQHEVEFSQESEGVSLGVEFFGSKALDSMIRGQSGLKTVESLLREDPALSSLFQVASARLGPEKAMQGIQAAVTVWNEAATLARAKNANQLPGAIGKQLGLTNEEGEFDPTLTFRLGVFNQEARQTTLFAPHFFVGRNLHIEADRQVYQLEMQVGGDAEFIGKEIAWKAKKASSSEETSDQGIHLSIGADGIGVGGDLAQEEKISEKHPSATVWAGKRLIVRTKKLTLQGARLEGETVDVEAEEVKIVSMPSFFFHTQWNAAASTTGKIHFSQHRYQANKVDQVSGIYARSHGRLKASSLTLVGGAVQGVDRQVGQLELQDIEESEKRSTLSFSSHFKGGSSLGISWLGAVSYSKQEQEGVTRALSGAQERERRQTQFIGAPILAFDSKQLKEEIREMQEAIHPTHKPMRKQEVLATPALMPLPLPEENRQPTKKREEKKLESPTPIVHKPLEEEREKQELDPGADERSTFDHVVTNWRKEEMREAESATALMRLPGEIVVWGAKQVCDLHPKMQQGCRGAKQFGMEAIQWVKKTMPTSWKEKIKGWLKELDQLNLANAREEQRLAGIPFEASMRYYQALNEIAMNVALTPLTIGVGQAFSHVAKRATKVMAISEGALPRQPLQRKISFSQLGLKVDHEVYQAYLRPRLRPGPSFAHPHSVNLWYYPQALVPFKEERVALGMQFLGSAPKNPQKLLHVRTEKKKLTKTSSGKTQKKEKGKEEIWQLPPEQEKYLRDVIQKSRRLVSNLEMQTRRGISEGRVVKPPSKSVARFDMSAHFYDLISQTQLPKKIEHGKVRIYEAKNRASRLSYVEKEDNLMEILQEMKALTTFHDLHLKYARIPKILGFQTNESNGGVLLTTRLPGKPFMDLLEELHALPPGSIERHQGAKKMNQAFYQLGQALGELHSKNYGSYPLPSFGIERHTRLLLMDYEGVQELANFYKLKIPHDFEEIQQVIHRFKKEPGFAGFSCNDPHLHNFLYQEGEGGISFIDVSAWEIDSLGRPEEHPLRYFYRTLGYIRYDTLDKVNVLERRAMIQAFQEGYTTTSVMDRSAPSHQFFNMRERYNYVITALEETKGESMTKQQRKEFVKFLIDMLTQEF